MIPDNRECEWGEQEEALVIAGHEQHSEVFASECGVIVEGYSSQPKRFSRFSAGAVEAAAPISIIIMGSSRSVITWR